MFSKHGTELGAVTLIRRYHPLASNDFSIHQLMGKGRHTLYSGSPTLPQINQIYQNEKYTSKQASQKLRQMDNFK